MKSIELNNYPQLLATNQITEEEGVNNIAEFISKNYPVFGLQFYDEDFREELIVTFLEKGTVIFKNYNPEIGDFFTYLYGYITNIESTLKKRNARNRLYDDLAETELKHDFHNSPYKVKPSEKPNNFFSESLVPYTAAKFSSDDLKNGYFLNEKSRQEKTILVLALKTSYYLSDIQIHEIAQVIDIDENYLRKMIDYFKKQLESKQSKRQKLETYRNKAYYCHRKYERQMQIIQEEMQFEQNTTQKYYYESKLKKLAHINKKQKSNWERLNSKFQNGFANMQPSNLAIANLTGICERQVSYYLFCAKSGKTDLSEIFNRLEQIDKD